MNIYELLKVKREEILTVATKYGAYNVRIFGSVARQEADADSDIDFLVEMEPGRSLFDLGGLLMELQVMLGCDIDVVTEKGLRSRIRERVLKEAIPL
jgi:predicted nucleotidyltransferase